MTYTNHVVIHINDLKAYREGKDVGYPPVEVPVKRTRKKKAKPTGELQVPPTVVLLSPDDRKHIASKMSINTAAKAYNIATSQVARCRKEYKRTNGQMDQGTTVLINRKPRLQTLEQIQELARDNRTAEEVAAAFGVSSRTVYGARELYYSGLLKR